MPADSDWAAAYWRGWRVARWPAELGKLGCVSRPESASPATGSEKSHKYEQQLLVDQAFGDISRKKQAGGGLRA